MRYIIYICKTAVSDQSDLFVTNVVVNSYNKHTIYPLFEIVFCMLKINITYFILILSFGCQYVEQF